MPFEAAQARFEHLTVMDGLPENSALSLLQDRLGFIWIGTQNGLARYDGRTMTTYQYDAADPYSFGGQLVLKIHEDRAGDLWFGTMEDGLVHYDRATGRFTSYRHHPEDETTISGDAVQSIYEDQRGDLWLGIGGLAQVALVDRFNRATGTFTRFRHDPADPKSLSDNLIFTTPSYLMGMPMVLHEDASGAIWLGTDRGGVNRFDPLTDTFTSFRHDPEDPGTLSSDRILSLTADQAGRLWIGTREGLNLFNPQTETVTRYHHDPDDPGSLAHDLVINVYEDLEGRLWISTMGGLDRFDPETEVFTHYAANPNPTDVSTVLLPLHEDENGLWMDRGLGELTYFDRASETVIPLISDPNNPQSLAGNRPISFLVDRTGTVWAGHQNSGLDKLVPTQAFQQYTHDPDDPQSISDNRIEALYEAPSEPGILWIGTEAGLDRLDRATGQITHYRHDEQDPRSLTAGAVQDVHEDRSGRLWVGTAAGLNRMDRRTGTFQRYEHDGQDPTTLPHPDVSLILETHNGKLWVGTLAGGLSRLDPETGVFTTSALADSTYHPNLYAALDTLTTGERQISAIRQVGNGADSTRTFDLDVATAVVVVVLGEGYGKDKLTDYGWIEDEKGERVWQMQWDESRSAGGIDWHRVQVAPLTLPPGRYRLRFVSDVNNSFNAWIGIPPDHPEYWGIQLLHVTPTESAVLDTLLTKPYVRNGLLDITIHSLLEDREGILWVGTNRGGLSRFDPTTGTVTTNFFDRRKGPMTVVDIHEDQDGRLWVVDFMVGLMQVDETSRTVERLPNTDGLPQEVLFMLEDDEGYLWLGGADHLARFDPETSQVRLFDEWHGMSKSKLNVGTRMADGTFFVGGENGLYAFDPRTMADDPKPPQVALTAFQLDGVDVLVGPKSPLQADISVAETVTLSHEENDFTFGFAAMHFARPERNTFAYKLEPYETEWSPASTIATARYTNLSSGQYTFRVKAANPDGVWNEQGASIRVEILPPWWRTTWAYLLYGLLFLVGLFSADRIQRRRLIAKERRRTQERELAQAREIEKAHIELQETHTHLKDTQAQLVQQEKMASLGQLTAGIAHEIKNPLNFVNNFAEVNEELADEAIEGLERGEEKTELLAILQDLKQNAQVINQHGKRADGIVQAMMQHASSSTGQREVTDINQLVAEHIDLAYHGKRAKVPDMTVEIRRDLAATTGTVEVVPQEVGRVLLNLLGNAFDAVHEHMVKVDGAYTPTVTVSTRGIEGQVEIRVSDNGPGIPAEITDRIFEPFFTTKPTGTGTGLGLSLSYDIVTQGHGGTLTVESEEGQGATFIVTLPVSKTEAASKA